MILVRYTVTTNSISASTRCPGFQNGKVLEKLMMTVQYILLIAMLSSTLTHTPLNICWVTRGSDPSVIASGVENHLYYFDNFQLNKLLTLVIML